MDLASIERRLTRPAAEGSFSAAEVAGLDEPVRRYLTAAITDGTPLAVSARLRMRGRIRLGRWVPFRARQILSPHDGFVWRARAAALVRGFDRYADGRGMALWKALGLVTVMHAEGPDTDRSAAGRAGAEAIWVPTALLPRFGVHWSAVADDHIVARHDVGNTPIEAHYRIDDRGTLRSVTFDRWGDPQRTGAYGWHPFGGEFGAHTTFGGVTVPSSGRLGWWYGTPQWADGEFFRFEITRLELVG